MAKLTDEISNIETEMSEKLGIVKDIPCRSTCKTKFPAQNSLFSGAIHSNQSSSSFETAEKSAIAFLHRFLERDINKATDNYDGHDIQQNTKSMKCTKLRMDSLKELLVRKSLTKAHHDELITDIQIFEAQSAITATKAREDFAVDMLKDALNRYDDAMQWHETEIKNKNAQFDAAKKYYSQCKEVLQLNPKNAGAKADVENAERAKDNAKFELELEKRSSQLCTSITALSNCTFRLLDLTVEVSKLEASMETEMHQKSSARIFSELALLRKQQWMDEHSDSFGGKTTEAQYQSRLALLKDEHREMKTSACYFSDDNLLDLYTWSKMVTSVVAAEQNLHLLWSRYAAEQSSVMPNSSSVCAAKKHLEGVMSEARQVILSSVQEHSNRKFNTHMTKEKNLVQTALANLMKSRSTSAIRSVVRDLAETSLTIAQDRLEKGIKEKFPEIDSADYLNVLEAAIAGLPQPK